MNLAAVYSRELDGQILTFATSGWTYNNTFILVDLETESMWYHLEGTHGITCISGFYADKFLPELGAFMMRWNEWFFRCPETKVLKNPPKP